VGLSNSGSATYFSFDKGERMDATRCPKCNKRLIAEADDAGRTELRCLKCDVVDPLKTEAAKWVESSLAQPPAY
jgi:phage FluMu protein Com